MCRLTLLLTRLPKAGRLNSGLASFFREAEVRIPSFTVARCANEFEQVPIPFGVHTGMKVIRCPARNLDPSSYRCRVEVEQSVWPTGRPGMHQALKHLKINIPEFLEHVRRLFSQTKELRESLDCWNPGPELVDLATEVHDRCRDLGPSHTRLIWGDQSKDTRHEVVSGRIDPHFGRDTVPRASLFIGKSNPHQLRPIRPRRCCPFSVQKNSTCHGSSL